MSIFGSCLKNLWQEHKINNRNTKVDENMKIFIKSNDSDSHGKGLVQLSSSTIKVSDNEALLDDKRDSSTSMPSEKNNENDDQTFTNEERDDDREEHLVAIPKIDLSNIISPMKSSSSIDDIAKFVDINDDTKSHDQDNISVLEVSDSRHRPNHRLLLHDKAKVHYHASKHSVKYHRDMFRPKVWKGTVIKEEETSTVDVLVGMSKNYGTKRTPLGDPTRPEQEHWWDNGGSGLSEGQWYSVHSKSKERAPSALEFELGTDIQVDVLNFAVDVVNEPKPVSVRKSLIFVRACQEVLSEDDVYTNIQMESIIEALTLIMRVHCRRKVTIARKVLQTFCDARDSIYDSDHADDMVMKSSLWAIRKFPENPLVIGPALSIICDYFSFDLGDEPSEKYVAFCADGGVEDMMKLEEREPKLKKKVETLLRRLFDVSAKHCLKYEEESEKYETDLVLLHCRLTTHRLERRFGSA